MKRTQVEQTGSRTTSHIAGRLERISGRIGNAARILFTVLLACIAGLPQPARANDVVLGWNANTEPDLAGYILCFGPASRQYDKWIDVRNTTKYIVSGLVGGTYYFSLIAYDTSGKESGYSNEISVMVSGIDNRPPVISAVSATGIGYSTATIGWTTDEPADAQVEYGLTLNYGSVTAVDPALATTHTVVLSGLASSTTYHYRVRSKDAAGNPALSGDFSFTTGAAPDLKPPVITTVRSPSVSNNSATISWVTDEPADTQIEYGTSVAYGSLTALIPDLVTSHSQVLSGLSSGTIYHFRVKSKDAASNQAVSSDCTFITAFLPDVNSGLVAAYAFDEGTGSKAADSSANSNFAVLSNATWTNKARFGRALSFNGKNSFISAGVAGLPDVSAPNTISCWLYANAGAGATQSIIVIANEAQQVSVRQSFKSAQVGMLQYEGTWLVAANPPSAKAWHHFAYTFDGTQNRFYIDGLLVSSSTVKPQAAPAAILQIGRWIAGSEYFKGIVDEVRIYSRALNQEEIKAVMNIPVAGSQPVLSGSAVFMEVVPDGSGSEAEEVTGHPADTVPCVEHTVAPIVGIRPGQDTYLPGETVAAGNYWISNPSECVRNVELKTWLETAGSAPVSVGRDDLDALLTLPAGLDEDFGPLPLFPLDGDSNTGRYRLTARIIDPITGDVLAEDVNSFTVGRDDRISGRDRITIWNLKGGPATLLEGRFGNLLYGDYDQVDGYRIVNNGDTSATVELKMWLEASGSGPIQVFALGRDGSLVLPAGSELTLDPLSQFLPPEPLPTGIYQLRARVLDRTTGEILCEDAAQLQLP